MDLRGSAELEAEFNPPLYLAPHASSVFSAVLPLFGVSVLAFCFGRRTYNMPKLAEVPLARWLVLGVYLDSWLFAFSSTVLNVAFGLRSSITACNAGILLCLICYLTTKVYEPPSLSIIIYFFLVEKVYIIRSKHKGPRRKDRLYLFNTLGMLLPYFIVIILTFIFRISELHGDGECYIGLRLVANIPLLVFDVVINVYLTSLFLVPLFGVCSFDQASQKVRNMAKRTFWGSIATLISTVANLATLVVLRGHEPGWICFACCNADVVFSAIVLHWVTTTDYDAGPEHSEGGVCFSCVELQNELNNELKKQGINPRNRCKSYQGPGRQGGEVITEITSKPHNDSYIVEGITVSVAHHTEVEDGYSTSRDSRENSEACCSSSDAGSVHAIRPNKEQV
ncbi:hypothetical protein TWF102_008768 [Orbilia oligospora]|uniref:Uncharacterized protein n=1 Tax=Orbilia oligospora TaxID=2813651 RepID=A0A7C8NCV1_ORBOL|nr:hypothetical protein TWF706_001520 [Orbilia oligospora]KAF3091481.1 hypothetical protein TWF102_008768 [Orbilia oligospora]KAF3132854.1 hypothetical protein TWF594_009371 [Orbilia oligospora]